MTDTAAAPAPSTPADSSASDTAIFAKFTAAHQKAVATELEKDGHADAPKDAHRGPAAVAQDAAGAPAKGATGLSPRGEDAGAERDGEGAADDAGSAADAKPDKEAPAPELSETDAIALARKARDEGDTEALDRALKVLLPGSKGLAEFNVDGKRYGELRAVANKERKKLDARAADLDTREANVSRGLAQVEQLVARYQPIEKLLLAAQGDDVDAFITLVETATKKPINETVKRHLDKKLGKPGDPEVEALKRELKAEREKREERERAEQEARQQAAHKEQIQRHLVFLDETLSKNDDHRVRALVKTPAGMRAIFEAQQRHYNAQTRSTISAEQAAKFVLDQKQKELEPWQRVLGGGSARAGNGAATADGKQEAIAPPPSERVRALGSRGASPASGGAQRLNDTELFEKYERLAKLAGD